MEKPRLIITGSKGRIGSIFANQLSDEYEILEIDCKPGYQKNYFQADISDFALLLSAFQKIIKATYLIHLAASPDPNGSWPKILAANIIGTKNVYECARLFGVKKIIYASSIHVSAGYMKEKTDPKTLFKKLSADLAVRPSGDYATSKVFGESLARQYCELYNIHSVCLRIGVFEHPGKYTGKEKEILKTSWISPRDLIQLVRKSLHAEVKFGTYYGVSRNKDSIWDISDAEKELGYSPVDDSSISIR